LTYCGEWPPKMTAASNPSPVESVNGMRTILVLSLKSRVVKANV
jgi:hypothetical protein